MSFKFNESKMVGSVACFEFIHLIWMLILESLSIVLLGLRRSLKLSSLAVVSQGLVATVFFMATIVIVIIWYVNIFIWQT